MKYQTRTPRGYLTSSAVTSRATFICGLSLLALLAANSEARAETETVTLHGIETAVTVTIRSSSRVYGTLAAPLTIEIQGATFDFAVGEPIEYSPYNYTVKSGYITTETVATIGDLAVPLAAGSRVEFGFQGSPTNPDVRLIRGKLAEDIMVHVPNFGCMKALASPSAVSDILFNMQEELGWFAMARVGAFGQGEQVAYTKVGTYFRIGPAGTYTVEAAGNDRLDFTILGLAQK